MKFTIIVAGGSGQRMNSVLPKQFIELAGKPILMRTIEKFHAYDPSMEIVLVLPKNHIPTWVELCRQHSFHLTHKIAEGGPTRFHSVKNGLGLIPDDGLVAIHDGVRPLVSHATIRRCFQAAETFGNAIPCIAVHETVRLVTGDSNQMLDRSQLKLIQTPQVFSITLLKKAFEQPYDESFTDDASVLERMGETIQLVEGNRENIKVTEPVDLIFAGYLIRNME